MDHWVLYRIKESYATKQPLTVAGRLALLIMFLRMFGEGDEV